MAVHNYTITFKSLRAGTVYTLSIGGGTGDAIPLKGGAQPFTTQEDDSDDLFTPVRTQSGYIRIVDDGKAADGVTAFDWKDLIPATDTERPVTLTHTSGTTTVTDWQGFMQAQNFSGVLYGNPQEREFPVQCCLSVLNATDAAINTGMLCNFAYLLNYIFTSIPSVSFNNYVFQGGTHARGWLLKKFDWGNFLNDTDDGVKARYNLLQILEDVCKFWGWTCRTHRNEVIFVSADDSAESASLTLTPAQLVTMAGGSESGSIGTMFNTSSLDDVFVSTNNDDIQMRGPGKASVKADVNVQKSVVEFAPQAVRKQMEQGGYTWVQGSDDMIGYFTTPKISSFNVPELLGSSTGANGHFCRRLIYASADAEDADEVDEILITDTWNGSESATAQVSLATQNSRIYSGGSLKMTASLFQGSEAISEDRVFYMRLGIGETRSTAKWFHYGIDGSMNLYWLWESTMNSFGVMNSGNTIKLVQMGLPYIPVPNNMFGKLFIEFLGPTSSAGYDPFEIGNFKIEFTRDQTVPPSNVNDKRSRTMKEKRITSKEYTATCNNKNLESWNADVIFASDNNMEIGCGLLMNPDGTFMETATYAGGNQHPEQHLANRVANYWTASKRKLTVELNSQMSTGSFVVNNIYPCNNLSFDSKTFHPVSINHEWMDDVTILTLLEL